MTATFCATLVDEWVRAGVTDAVVAPGSRSTPLVLALHAHPAIAVHVHLDERAAAFTALGLGLASGRPAVVVTTSGTAAAEVHPAVVEADLAGVPMLVATANRPPELHDVGAPQTVDQRHLFGRAVRWFAEPGPPTADTVGTWRSLGARAVAAALDDPAGPGPVHLDLAFREPLVGAPAALPPGRADGAPWHTAGGSRVAVERSGTERLAALLDVDRGVIVAGAGCGEPGAVLALAEATGWPVIADPRSGCRLPDPRVITMADAVLRHEPAAARLRPEAVLRLGEAPASKVLEGWLAEVAVPEVAVHGHGRWFDPGRRAAHVLHADPTAVCNALARLVRRTGNEAWAEAWTAADQVARLAVETVLVGHPEPTDPGVARAAVAALGEGGTLVVSSSMPVRDLEWYGGPVPGVRVLANRGANGIDGVVSTGVGAALAARRASPTVVLVGDVALLHDANALLGLARRPVDCTIVVVDNDGGAIFSFLPQAQALDPVVFEELFGTPHGVDLAALAAVHAIPVTSPVGAVEVGPAIEDAVRAGGVRLVHVRTDRAATVAVHDELHAAVAHALDHLG